MAEVVLIDAPSILGLRPTGVETLPDALLSAGLLERLHARHDGRIVPEDAYDPTRDPTTLALNGRAIASFSRRLADAVADVIRREEFPIVLGGDCSIMLGGMLALRRRGRYGLLFVDGHADFYQPEANPNGEAASMDLALATGRGPELLTNLEGLKPLVLDEDVVAFGCRDQGEQLAYGSQPLPEGLLSIDLATIRHRGIAAASGDAVAHLTRDGGPDAGFWVHLDADVLADEIMPAVDYRIAGGVSWTELSHVLRVALQSGRAVGLEVTIYNPVLDPDGAGARGLVNVIAGALA
jgi:arginase